MPAFSGTWIGIALGGALGSVCRYALQGTVQAALPGAFPAGTLAVNLLGSAAIGVLAALFEAFAQTPAAIQARLFLMVGVLGGFTTFSSFSLENLNLLRAGEWRTALIYVLSANVGGILLAAGGYALCRAFVSRSLA